MAGIWKALDVADSVSAMLNNYFGVVEDRVTVRVAGGPRSTKAGLQQIAAAVAFGIAIPAVPLGFGALPPPGNIMIEYDATKMEVVFEVKFVRGLKSMLAGAGRAFIRGMPVFAGPPDSVTGGGFVFRPPVPGGVAPALTGWEGRTMLTNSLTVADPNPALPLPTPVVPTLNPRPTGDARSRGNLCWMVWQTLATPAEFATQSFPLPRGPLFPGDVDRFSGT